ncbi:cache domain-containing protein, partial [Noviherbaspirillum denitrificans]|uniref:cache domain-containing protein n=1 Tax=Noviherbaspirillum denitrificans TaxID=1968433 RepID=UPI001981999F
AKGVKAACERFNDRSGPFALGQFFIFALDMEGNTLATAMFPERLGQNVIEARDANGKPFIREMIELARSRGRGWCDYLFSNPVTHRDELKSTYLEAAGGIIVSCGIYKNKPALALPPR